MLQSGVRLLRSRYTLLSELPHRDPVSQAWLGVDEDDNQFLIKAWPFTGPRPDDLHRALWDAELRMLYRVGSSPGADRTILVIRDAGIDKHAHCFAMVLEAPGYDSLAEALRDRGQTDWLRTRDLQTRRSLWSGLALLVDGIALLHEQQIIHRDVRPETIYLAGDLGPSSLRLGGFEWSVRLGRPATNVPPPSWSSPPEFFQSGSYGYRPETDWYGFGMLAVRLLLNVESYSTNDPTLRHSRVLAALDRSANHLTGAESALLTRLIARDPRERLSRGYEVSTAVKDILAALELGGPLSADSRPLVLVVNPRANDVVERATESGFVPNPDTPHEPFNPLSALHCSNLLRFVQQDLRSAQLFAVPNARSYILVGAQLVLRVVQFEFTDTDTGHRLRTWDFAYCQSVTELRWNEGDTAAVALPVNGIVARSRMQLKQRAIRQNAKSWHPYLPAIDPTVQLRANLALFHQFIRCTNQLELLIRDSEIFCYNTLNRVASDGINRLTIVEERRPRPPVAFAALEGGMCEYLSREIESNKPFCKLVVLTPATDDALVLPRHRIPDAWTVEHVDLDARKVCLARVSTDSQLPDAPATGVLRTWGMFGQVALIGRRKRAIDRIEKHTYLLRSLSSPGQVYMDTGVLDLPSPLSLDLVDEAKQAAIKDILRVRPIYALQGPPGTGKTTLVAHLLRQIFEDDPVAQVLITAQAHGAVDVLRGKVREAYRGVPEQDQPLAVRLGLSSDRAAFEEGSVEQVSLRLLQTARTRLEAQPTRTPFQGEWLAVVIELERSVSTWDPDSSASDFCELVMRGANITYCTTSASDLEALAKDAQSFDWAIIEEAGKAHAFDLALPLQAGHRWLLIGDHLQLPPYRFTDYRDGIDGLDDAVAALERLRDRAGDLLDRDWIREWQNRNADERSQFKEYARRWLNTFERVFEYCSHATGSVKLTVDEADGAAAGILSRQHRMHPTIGNLISTCYYNGRLANRTTTDDGRGLPRVRHGLKGIPGLHEQAILWLDLPWAARDPAASEVGPIDGRPRYTNPREVATIVAFLKRLRGGSVEPPVDIAVLSAYNQQVAAIRREVTPELVGAAGLRVKESLHGRLAPDRPGPPGRVSHTVDSFQGNQAGVIVVSLVRNNTSVPGSGLGFLEEASRVNVLLSRAERLLVLVGSWEFLNHQLREVSIDDPHLPLWHWRMVVTTLEGWFEEGVALKVAASDLLPGETP